MHIRDGIPLHHLDRLTDTTGLIQHAIYSVPRRESGYTTDDNARALRLCTRLWCRHPEERMLNRVTGYLSFVEYARRASGGFHNFLGYQRQWLDAEGSGDCQGQAVRALAEVLGSNLPDDYRALARELIDVTLPILADLRSIRALAYVIMAWEQLWSAEAPEVERLEKIAWVGARRLVECYHRSVQPDWQWFESRLAYANAVLPHALFLAGRRWPKEAFLEVAETSFAFLDRATTAPLLSTGPRAQGEGTECIFWPIGNSGWYPHGEAKAAYDQQPVEAATMAEAALAAFAALNDVKYLATFRRADGWFRGQNSQGQPLVDDRLGACFDGLQPLGVNRNQGAESTLAYLWTEVHSFELQQALGDKRPAAASA